MSRSVLFYPDEAMELNKSVQEKIAPHLFLFCNYNPTPLKAFSADARFFKAVLNFYKLLIDSGVVNRVNKLCKEGNILFDLKQLKKYEDWANNARTVAGHNLSEQNSTDGEILKYERWLKEVIGKTEIECVEDYEKPLQKLEGMAASTMKILKDFVDFVSTVSPKDKIIASWEQCIIEFYCKDMNKTIFLGQIKEAYASIHRGGNGDFDVTDFKVSKWIQDSYYRREEREIKNLQVMLDYVVCKNLGESVRIQLQQKIQEAQASMEQREITAAGELGCNINVFRSSVYNYKKHYCCKLKDKLNIALNKIKQIDSGTMMPHDIMQKIIAEDFGLL